jgi:hypothetical protein
MKSIPLDQLPQWSPWPSRLLGITPWTVPRRTLEKVTSEYDQDKFARCLDYCKGLGAPATPEDVRRFEMGGDGARKVCVSQGDELFEVSLEESRALYDSLLHDTLGPLLADVRTVVELGAGYGYNLWSLRRRFGRASFVGGELSPNAVAVAERLYRGQEGLSVRPFNFYDPASYALVSTAEPPVLVFTSYALEQLTHAAPFLDGLRSCRRSLKSVVLFESLYDEDGRTLLSQLRRRYTEVNDYNRDLYAELSRQPDLRISSCRRNVFGQNPLHAISLVQWMFL